MIDEEFQQWRKENSVFLTSKQKAQIKKKRQYSSSPACLDDLTEMNKTVLSDLPDMVTEGCLVKEMQYALANVEQSHLEKAFDATLS